MILKTIKIVISIVALQSFAQELPTIIPPSPTVAGLMHFEELPVDYYSGQPDIQIPIYNKSIGSNVTIPITLRYHTLGLRVDERSGWVGTGWSLDGEAVISRTVRGIRDEANDTENQNVENRFEVGVYHNGFFDLHYGNNNSASSEEIRTFQNFVWNSSGKGTGSLPLYLKGGAYDKELDLYQLSLFGSSARFVIIKNDYNSLEVKMLNNPNNLKVTPNYNTSSFEITSFEVLDTNGVKYVMDVTEISTTNTITTITPEFDIFLPPNPNYSLSNYTSAWKLREIRNISNQLLATCTYQQVNEKFEPVDSRVSSKVPRSKNGHAWHYLHFENNPFLVYNRSLIDPKYSYTSRVITLASQKLNSIEFRDQSKINFKMSTHKHPEYDNSGSILEEIEIIDSSNQLFKRYRFDYSGINTSNRLFLDRIQEYSKFDPDPLTYSLTYKDKEKLPSAQDHSKNMDVWGYYRESYYLYPRTPKPQRIPEKSADKNLVDTGSLVSISYPTGGIKLFDFESHTLAHQGFREFTDTEFKNYNQDNWDWSVMNNLPTIDFNFDLNNSVLNDISDIIEITAEQEIQYIGVLEIGDSNDPVVASTSENVIVTLEKVGENNEVLEDAAFFNILDSRTHTLQPGRYRLRSTSYAIPSINSPYIKAKGTLHFRAFKNITKKVIYGGGLRIGSITFKDSDNTVKKHINYSYNMNQNNGPESDGPGGPGNGASIYTSSGVVDGFLTRIKEYTKQVPYIMANPNEYSDNNQKPRADRIFVVYDKEEYFNSVHVSLTKGNFVGYRKVTVSEISNGKSVYEYTSAVDFPTYPDENYLQLYPSVPLKEKYQLHGSLVKQTIYDNGNRKLKEIFNTYKKVETLMAQSLYTHDTGCPWYQFYSTYQDYLDRQMSQGRNPSGFTFDIQNCNPITNPTALNTDIGYAPVDHYYTRYLLNETITKDYVYDTQNNVSEIERTETLTYDPSNYLVSERNTYYTERNIEQHLQSKYFYPLTTPSPYSNNILNSSNRIHEVLGIENYKNGQKISTLQNSYGVFDTEATNDIVMLKKVRTLKGEFNSVATSPDQATGNGTEERILYHDYDSFGNPLEVSQADGIHITYIWSYNQMYPVAKIENTTFTEVASALGITEQQLREYNSDASSINALNGLRASLPNAMVTTYTYEPLIGISSVTDPRGYLMTYHYDEFNRLEFVKDTDGNLISENKYNYKN